MLDPEAILAFVHVADMRNFTRAAEALGTTQSAISLRLKRLEAQLGQQLIERTPRSVRLSGAGAVFLAAARELLAANDRARTAFGAARRRLAIGISHHLVGPELPTLLRRMSEYDSAVTVEMHVAASHEVLQAFDASGLDAALTLRHDTDRRGGEAICRERLGWYGAVGWTGGAGEPLRLASQASPCGLRAMATRALDRAGIPWTEVFVGGGVATIGAAISAGLAVGILVRRAAPPGLEIVGARLGLPELPVLDVALYSRVSDPILNASLRSFVAAFRAAATG